VNISDNMQGANMYTVTCMLHVRRNTVESYNEEKFSRHIRLK